MEDLEICLGLQMMSTSVSISQVSIMPRIVYKVTSVTEEL